MICFAVHDLYFPDEAVVKRELPPAYFNASLRVFVELFDNNEVVCRKSLDKIIKTGRSCVLDVHLMNKVIVE
jgi:hypothetical protein